MSCGIRGNSPGSSGNNPLPPGPRGAGCGLGAGAGVDGAGVERGGTSASAVPGARPHDAATAATTRIITAATERANMRFILQLRKTR